MNHSLLPRHFKHSVVLLGMSLLGACTENRSPSERVRAFCDEIRIGEQTADVESHFLESQLQIGGVAPAQGTRSTKSALVKERHKVTGILAEASGSMNEVRPVCAIYYSDPFLTGDGSIVHKEFIANWVHR